MTNIRKGGNPLEFLDLEKKPKKDYYEQSYPNKCNNLNEVNKFFASLPKLTQEEKENLNSPVPI